jgi:transcriptional regulator with XRE-family HTH domain
MNSNSFGKRLTAVRKGKKMSQDEVAKIVGVHDALIGRYEREEITPSIEVAKKMADALDVSLDYLTGGTSTMVKDKKMLYRSELLQKVSQKERDTILHVLDALLQTAQLSTTQQKLM